MIYTDGAVIRITKTKKPKKKIKSKKIEPRVGSRQEKNPKS
jgi:hypothetical protein